MSSIKAPENPFKCSPGFQNSHTLQEVGSWPEYTPVLNTFNGIFRLCSEYNLKVPVNLRILISGSVQFYFAIVVVFTAVSIG